MVFLRNQGSRYRANAGRATVGLPAVSDEGADEEMEDDGAIPAADDSQTGKLS